jgi:hypothetical protein
VLKVRRDERPGEIENGHEVGLSGEIWSLMTSCWEKNPGDRPLIEDVVDTLANVLGITKVCIFFSLSFSYN